MGTPWIHFLLTQPELVKIALFSDHLKFLRIALKTCSKLRNTYSRKSMQSQQESMTLEPELFPPSPSAQQDGSSTQVKGVASLWERKVASVSHLLPPVPCYKGRVPVSRAKRSGALFLHATPSQDGGCPRCKQAESMASVVLSFVSHTTEV